jgi:hypothetical protein
VSSLQRRFSIVAMVTGALIIATSLAVGFFALLTDQDELAKRLLPLVPLGFLIGFTGLVASLFTGSRRDGPR